MKQALHQLLTTWISLSLIAALPLAVWTIGRQEGIVVRWLWLLLLVLPGAWFIWRKANDAVLEKTASALDRLTLISRLAWGLLLLVIGTLYALPLLVTFTSQSPQTILLRSLIVLLPLEGLLLVLVQRIGASDAGRSPHRREPGSEGRLTLPEELKQQFTNAIQKNQIEVSFRLLSDYLENGEPAPQHRQTLLLLNQQWNETLQDANHGVLTQEEEKRQKATIVRALLRLVH